jgi:hypothetical protein
MLRKISLGLLCLAASINTSSYAIENNPIQSQSITMEYELVPNKPELFTNYMFWSIEARCKIISEDESDALNVTALAKKGKINDVPLSAGQSIQITVHHNETLKLGADSGAKVEITNLGTHTVKASCTA